MNLSSLFPAQSSIKSIQSGLFGTASPSIGAAEDSRYVDITISAVNPSKCVLTLWGGAGDGTDVAWSRGGNGYTCTMRLINATTLRISSPTVRSTLVGRWTVVEYA